MLVLVTLLSSIIIGVLGWQTGQRALQNAIVNQLSTVRLSQALQIEKYFDQIFRHTRTLAENRICLLYTSPSPRDRTRSRMPSSA